MNAPAIDPVPARRALATAFGADVTIALFAQSVAARPALKVLMHGLRRLPQGA